ncbi:SRPBCC domain-containing protein [Cytobacillus spongiae]|jgi:uncharacterized protein YndB with AHSA1/START domain|uniref:SRPBCC family protein n=1 Tax=Cytobacillus spongiae TaxID=2901381 RepID=UPI001F40915D|nr:SRPBCC domain-containing protein [Cytobacillus spongiae]UII56154.1 SRPBCC domain-containing protein [Cytobacillus spongiae]
MVAKKTKQIEVSKDFPYPIELVWEAITNKEALSQWFMETDFEPVVGKKFQFRSKPMKGWRGYVDGEVLEVNPVTHLKFSWQGMPTHSISFVRYELLSISENSTKVTAIHEGFDQTHGWLSGYILRGILKSGWKKMFNSLLPQVLENAASGKIGKAISK